ncbi:MULTISPECIES: cation:proton antiporter [Anaerostipes]|uniref:cation:proton antiporter n=1 Tax=Anaerostipes TaxID=207244 RepID=UPI000951C8A2|nr:MULTISPECIES: cation:proton antiporter [Anaerostipes]MCI5623794.1 cation:proton antiporter [Anaerostipes sp.]MDY2726693.1 cation:proton antiporter [Anaerostipes faecalis]OLR58772.1 sodium:proton antiporter [Anaerostipes sp. 494a]
MEEYKFLLDFAIILALTKSFSLISRKFNMPPVVGALLAGIILGPVVLDVVTPSETILNLAEVGVVVLMFEAGLETDINELKRSGLSAFIIALCGVMVPLIMGAAVTYVLDKNVMESVFMGVVLTATSVSITVETLQDMGKLKGRVGTAILGAAIIDDILGIILLSMMTSVGNSGSFNLGSIMLIIGKMAAFFAIAGIGGFFVEKFFEWMAGYKDQSVQRNRRRVAVFALAFCFGLAFLAELFGIADITGAYLAGIILCRTPQNYYIHRKIDIMSYMLVTPIFFASIGLKVDVHGMSNALIIFTVILCVAAVASKILGCGIGGLLCRYNIRESLQIGAGMVCRGEVALIVAQKGIGVGLLSETYFAPVVIMVLVTTLLSPILLKVLFTE